MSSIDHYLIHCEDWQLLEERPQTLCRQFARHVDEDVFHFAPVLLAEYSCLTQFVHEELDLVVSNQSRYNDARLSLDEFINFWGWFDKLQTKVYFLSGGWRKLLALSLFLNRKCANILIVDFTSHLSDMSIAFVLGRMSELGIRRVAFVEYDAEILVRHLSRPTHLQQSAMRLLKMAAAPCH